MLTEEAGLHLPGCQNKGGTVKGWGQTDRGERRDDEKGETSRQMKAAPVRGLGRNMAAPLPHPPPGSAKVGARERDVLDRVPCTPSGHSDAGYIKFPLSPPPPNPHMPLPWGLGTLGEVSWCVD